MMILWSKSSSPKWLTPAVHVLAGTIVHDIVDTLIDDM
jgi:hypothetical protein